MIDILKPQYIFIVDEDLKKRNLLLQKLSHQAVDLQIALNEQKVYQSFLKREKIDSTGMNNKIAIPHAFDETIIKPAVIINILRKPIYWKTIDQENQVQFIIALLIPTKNRQKEHLKYLSLVAQKLLDPEILIALKSFDTKKIYKSFS